MKKNKLYISITILIVILLFSAASIFNQCERVYNRKIISKEDTDKSGADKIENSVSDKSAEEINKEEISKENSYEKEDKNKYGNIDEEKILFNFAALGDNRPADINLPQPDVFLDILKYIKEYNPDFLINTGDIINGGTDNEKIIKRQFLDYLEALSILSRNTYTAPGNHGTGNDISRKYFKELINNGGDLYYYFKHENVYFIILNAYEKGSWGKIQGQQLSWLENLLEKLKEERVFVAIHPPLYSVMNPDCITDGSLHISFSDKENQDYLRYLFNKYKVDCVLSGHEHSFHKQQVGNTTYIITACSGAYPYFPKDQGGFYHFLIIEIKSNSWLCNVIDADGNLIEKEEIIFN